MNKEFSSRDLYLASVLVCIGFPVERVDWQLEGGSQEKKVAYFIFSSSEDILDAEKKFWRGELAVEPKKYIESLKALRYQIANVYKNPHLN
jgi:hypothetical protein